MRDSTVSVLTRQRFAKLLCIVLLLPLASPGSRLAADDGGSTVSAHAIAQFGEPPPASASELSSELKAAVQVVAVESMENSRWGLKQDQALDTIRTSADPRLAWILSDLMRFVADRGLSHKLGTAAGELLKLEASIARHWGVITDHLMAWNIPAPPDYLRVKRAIFTSVVPAWNELFVEGDIDWRHVSWGGVLIDDRAYDTTEEPCNCIPGVDNPALSSADEANWLADDDIVFGVVINGEARAYPRQIMEVREMVNDTLGGRDLAIPYCTLCGSAQAWFTDELPDGIERPILRTSGLLIRSNKVMYDIVSQSVFDTFRGHAVTGPLAELGIRLSQASVITTEWGRWKSAYPDTTVLVEALALGRNFDFRTTRDANGPIFPIGDVDPRLPVHEDIIGAITASGQAVAFQRSAAFLALSQGKPIAVDNIELKLDAGGIRAVDRNGDDVGSHQAFWFAWSQFHPQTKLWPDVESSLEVE